MMRQLALVVLLITAVKVHARIGLADWQIETPGGNRINNFIERSLYLEGGGQIDGLKRWYFFRGHIVGEQLGEPYIEHTSRGDRYSFDAGTRNWFIVDERSAGIATYRDSLEWQRELEQQVLVPRLYTRWLDGDPTVLTNGMFWILWFASSWYTAIPILLLVIMVFRRAWKREHFNWRRPYTIGAMVIGLFVLSRVFFENYLQSF